MGGYMILGRQSTGLTLRPDPTVTIKVQIPGYGDVAMDVPGENIEEAEATLREWLKGEEGDDDWRTIHAKIDGQSKRITFRASWVAGFSTRSEK